MTVLVDMDDVLENLVIGWTRYLNEKFGTDTRAEDIDDWNICRFFPGLTREQVYSAEKDDSFWDYVGPKEGADEALRKLIADGHEIYVVTSTYYETLKTKMENVLFRYYPYIDWDHVIVTSAKHMVKGDVLIDDGPHNFIRGEYRKILFEMNHNKNFDEKSVGAVRVRNWEEAYEEVKKIAKEQAL